MSMSTPECPACRIRMQEGFVIDIGHGGQLHGTKWTEGRLEKGLMGGLKVKGRKQLETVTFRCPRCGWLIWFAPDAPRSTEG